MARIVNKLNLNKTPQVVENNSLIFAKNIKLMKDGMLGRDSGIKKLDFSTTTLYNTIENSIRLKLSSINSRIGSLNLSGVETSKKDTIRIIEREEEFSLVTPVNPAPANAVSINSKSEINAEHQKEQLNLEINKVEAEEFNLKHDNFIETFFDNARIVGVIPYNTTFYTFWANLVIYNDNITNDKNDKAFLILKYDEKTDEISFEHTGWTWSGGEITGNVIVNLNSDIILNIAEYLDDEHLIPFKSINLNRSSYYDDESIYTQSPKIPITNLRYVGNFTWQIPNGVYQFFIRYKIRKGIYTGWLPCTNELFTGNSTKIDTSQGTVKYTDVSKDSSKSFVFNLDIVYNNSTLDTFQLGFIVSHDDSTYAKIWKEFSIDNSKIYFDYKEHEGVDEDITNMLTPIFDVYNIKNVIEFKNKLYISNYVETNFNVDFRDVANLVSVNIRKKSIESATDPDTNYSFTTEDVTIHSSYGLDVVKTFITEVNEQSVCNIVAHILNTIVPLDTRMAIGTQEESLLIYLNEALASAVNGEYYGFNYSISDIQLYQNISGGTNEAILLIAKYSNLWNTPYKLVASSRLYETDNNHVIIDINSSFTQLSTNVFTYVDPVDNVIRPLVSSGAYTSINNDYNKYKIIISKPNGGELSFVVTFSTSFVLSDNRTVEEYTTLVPFQKYKFYIHFVKDDGEITNGYEVGEEIQAPYKVDSILYPVFDFDSNFKIPKGYCSFFFSIAHTGNKVIHITNIHVSNNEDFDTHSIGDAPEIDTMLSMFSAPFDVTLVPQTAEGYEDLSSVKAQYVASGNGIDVHTFGANGKVLFDDVIDPAIKDGFIIQESTFDKDDLTLVKCTPYIPSVDKYSEFEDDFKQYNLLGYVNAIYKVEDGIDTYVADRDYYIKEYVDHDAANSRTNLLDINEDSVDPSAQQGVAHALKYGYFVQTPVLFVYSSYNLNYLALTNDVGTPKGTIKGKVLRFTFDSLLLSSMYTVPSMYYNYVRYPLAPYSEENYTIYDNTIRSSKLQGDEDLHYKIIFNSTDYYNMPTNKGIITKLISVGDAILVHTEDSLFKFSGSNTLSESGGEDIQTIESEPFETGVSEIFGSQNGFAGLQDIHACCVSQAGYMFYDNSANVIYYYTSGQDGGLKTISDDIHKLINYYSIDKVRFGDDFENNRIFVNILFSNNKTITLSFNTITKSFISLHDFKFTKSFSTKNKCYFWESGTKSIFQIDNNAVGYLDLTFDDTIYPYKVDDVNSNNKQAIIDVLYNVEYQRIKTLNYINYIVSKVESFASAWQSDIKNKLLAEETLDRHYPSNYIRIYSDSCCTDLIDCSNATPESNISILSRYSMIKPIYNQGVWSLNVFRNILDTTDITQSDSLADNKSLIYGKYFVVRFVFNANINFKLENVSFNII